MDDKPQSKRSRAEQVGEGEFSALPLEGPRRLHRSWATLAMLIFTDQGPKSGDDREVPFVYRDKPDGSLHFTGTSTPYVAHLLAIAAIVLKVRTDL